MTLSNLYKELFAYIISFLKQTHQVDEFITHIIDKENFNHMKEVIWSRPHGFSISKIFFMWKILC